MTNENKDFTSKYNFGQSNMPNKYQEEFITNPLGSTESYNKEELTSPKRSERTDLQTQSKPKHNKRIVIIVLLVAVVLIGSLYKIGASAQKDDKSNDSKSSVTKVAKSSSSESSPFDDSSSSSSSSSAASSSSQESVQQTAPATNTDSGNKNTNAGTGTQTSAQTNTNTGHANQNTTTNAGQTKSNNPYGGGTSIQISGWNKVPDSANPTPSTSTNDVMDTTTTSSGMQQSQLGQ